MHTVYLLGAGASKASKFKMPTMAEFFDLPGAMVANPELSNFLTSSFPPFPPTSVNLEDVMTHLDVSLSGPARTWGYEPEHLKVLRSLHQFIRDRLWFDPKEEPCPLHVKLLKKAVDEKATVLSLNYDLILDHALKRTPSFDMAESLFLERSLELLDDEYGNSLASGMFIKLHGALNWWRCRNERCRNRESLLIYPYGIMDEIEPDTSMCRQCGHGLETAIVPPTMKGVFERFGRLGFAWATALNCLHIASTVVVIGVSFSPSDYVLRWLIRESPKSFLAELVVVNPDPKAASVACPIFNFPRYTWYQSFDDFLDSKDGKRLEVGRTT